MPTEARFQALFEAIPTAALAVDDNGVIAHANEQAVRLLGYRRDRLLGMDVERLVPERFRAGHAANRADYLRAPRTREMGSGLDLYVIRGDGEEIPVDIKLSRADTFPPLTITTIAVRQIEVDANKAIELLVRRFSWSTIKNKVLMIVAADAIATFALAVGAATISADQNCVNQQRTAAIVSTYISAQNSNVPQSQLHKLFPTLSATQLDRLIARSKAQQQAEIHGLRSLARSNCATLF